MIAAVPRVHQTENHMIDAEFYWTKVGAITWGDLAGLVETPSSLWRNGDAPYHGTNDRIDQTLASQFSNSLFLIEPETTNVQVQTEGGMFGPAKRRVRADFRYNGTVYNFIVTDPVAEQGFLARANGVYPMNNIYLCISLTEAYEGDGCCHKLVATSLSDQLARLVMQDIVFTIGHSTRPAERFIALLKQHNITALADVRSKPYSRMNPQFNREDLKEALRESGIAYVFLGKELGARTEDRSCYHEEKVQYGRLAQTELFHHGLDRAQEGAKKYRIALMYAEKDTLVCHRTILVARHLETLGLEVRHIHGDGQLETHADAMRRLLRQLHLPEGDMFSSREEIVAEAYRLQEERVAYSASDGAPDPSAVRSVAE